MKITVEIFYADDVPELSQRYVAPISEGDYKAMVVTGSSISDCFKELSISMFILDDFKAKQRPNP